MESRLVPSAVPTPDHVVVVMEENHAYSEIIGSSSAPYINSLASQGALMTNSFAIEHPSEPNYLDIFSGSNQGITKDGVDTPGSLSSANLGQEFLAKGLTWGAYIEGITSYDHDHAPWDEWNNNGTPGTEHDFSTWPTDFTQLPKFSIITPNLNDDMHDGTIQQGDTWLKNHLDSYAQWAKSHNSLLIVTWDEDDGTQSNQVATIFVGQMVNSGQYGEHINHFNVLRTIEDMYGLSYAGASASATPITDIWTTPGTPAAPSGLAATAAGTDQINLSWTDNSSNETGFVIDRSTDGQTFTQVGTVGADVTSYSDTGLTAGTRYYYEVAAYNAAGDSAFSNVASDTARGVVRTLELSGPSSTTAGTAFSVTVTALDAYGNVATGYAGTVHFTSTDSAATLPADSTLANGQGTFTVTLNTLGNQTLTTTDTADSSITGSATLGVAPAAPSNLTATAVSSSSIQLTWTDNSNGETGFQIERSTDGIHWSIVANVGADVTSYLNTGLRKRTKYYYRVSAYYTNPDGTILFSDYSNEVNATTKKH